jgi:sialic acid synthase SpsE
MKVVAEAGTCNGSISYAFSAAVRAWESGADMFKVQLYRKGSLFRPDAPV